MFRMNRLTPRQKQVLEIINSYTELGKPFPTLQEIAGQLGVRHKSGVTGHIKALERKGYITRREQRISNFLLKSDEGRPAISDDECFPLVGVIPAGTPLQSFEQDDSPRLSFNHHFFGGGNLLAVTISGDSMQGDSICDGDTAIIRMQSDWKEQDIVAARVGEDEVTLKRIQPLAEGQVALVPSNPDYPVKVYPEESVQVLGILSGLVRKT